MSFFGRLKSSTQVATVGNDKPSPAKKDPNATLPTPLEKLLADYPGPIRENGSDKFFGFENFGSTCYCNSIIQCLYYSVPFREQVVNFPERAPIDSLQPLINHKPKRPTAAEIEAQKNGTPTSPKKVDPTAPPRPEDLPSSPEYKKKQALAAGPILAMEFENSNAYGMSESLFTSLKDIFEAVIAHRSRIGVVSPNKFLEILRRENEMFRTAMHQDAHEFLNLLLNEVVENVEQHSQKLLTNGTSNSMEMSLMDKFKSKVGPSNTGWVHELFEGTLTSETRCLTCENTSQRDEAFLDLSVDLDQHSSVTSCLRKFSEEEMLCERNKFHCDNCGGLQEAEKRMKIKRLPKILALHLKRFKYTEDLQRLQKLFHRVVYPYYLRLFNTTDDAEDPDRLYELYAVVVHIGGGPYHGHYVSIIKTEDRGWLLFDDEMVEPVDKDYVRNFFGGDGQLACAYVLFYQETTVEHMERELEADAIAAAEKAAREAQLAGEHEHGAVKVKTNGTNGLYHAHTSTSPLTPTIEEEDHFASLDHAATAPAVSPPAHDRPPVKSTSSMAFLSRFSKSPTENGDTPPMSRKERNALEKAQKVADREAAKERMAKRKEMVERRREYLKQQEAELEAAIEASKQTKAEEDRRATDKPNGETNGTSTPAGDASTASVADSETPLQEGPLTPGTPGTPGTKGGALDRFRQSSMSLRQKPKFWPGSKDRDESETRKSEDAKKNRFSLGRKKSAVLS